MPQDKCVEAGAQATAKVGEYYDPRIKQVRDLIQEIKDKGGNPDKIAVDVGGGNFKTLPEILKLLRNNKEAALDAIDGKVADCNAEIKPFQDLVDFGIEIASGGLSNVLPARMTHVDVSQILAGYPLGGPNAFIPKLREDILSGLGVGGDVADFIRDPLKVFR